MKQFLKPNWKKILLFILLLYFLSSLISSRNIGEKIIFNTENKEGINTAAIIINSTGCEKIELNPLIWWPLILINGKEYSKCGEIAMEGILISLSYWMIVSYLASCSIFLVCSKFRRKT
jgi:hypothetical protein